ncbi:MAG: Fe-S cluster assembly protein HesB [Propionibacteriales bacterium]|nr:Fe-S cluster assembly protein HesB [Propionibacteriales bacterium]
MLSLTENATNVIKTITEGEGAPTESGLRISQDSPQSTDLAVTAAEGPQPGDQVVEEEGARVFLEPTAAQTLDDKVLDAQVDAQGGVEFSLTLQPGQPGDNAVPQQ